MRRKQPKPCILYVLDNGEKQTLASIVIASNTIYFIKKGLDNQIFSDPVCMYLETLVNDGVLGTPDLTKPSARCYPITNKENTREALVIKILEEMRQSEIPIQREN